MASVSDVSDIPKLTMNPSPIITPDDNGSKTTGYKEWSDLMRTYLKSKDLWSVIELSSERVYEEVNYEIWTKKNMTALKAIQDSCASDAFAMIQGMSSAKIAWDILAGMNKPGAQFGLSSINFGDISKLRNPPVPTIETYFGLMIYCFDDERKRYGPFVKAIYNGDWDATKKFLDHNSEALTAKISQFGHLPIHRAAMSGHVHISEKLVELMKKEDLEIQDSYGNTALHHAALGGSTKIAACLTQKNDKLVHISNLVGNLPVSLACKGGHTDVTHYLYRSTDPAMFYPENGLDGYRLVCLSISSRMLHICLDLLRRCPKLITSSLGSTSALVMLAQAASFFPSASQLSFWKRWIYSGIHVQLPSMVLNDQNRQENSESQECIDVPSEHVSQKSRNLIVRVFGKWRGIIPCLLKSSGIKQVYDLKFTHIYALQILQCMCSTIATSNRTEINFIDVQTALLEATKYGNIEFVIEMIKANPDLLDGIDLWGRTIIMLAIAHRQEKIFSLIYGLDARRYTWINTTDISGNNMLHWAGMPAPSSQLDRISGATLQMQRELQWFKEVESMLQPSDIGNKNGKDKTPRQIFTESHRELKIEGEKWMKRTATSCTVVGALVITIMFTAAFSVPGGNVQDTGFPIFQHENSFTVFIFSDAVSLFASSTSVLMFLGILTARYAEEDFLKSLPTKLIIGLSLLFVSLAAMMTAFCAALIVVLNGRLWIVIPTTLLASVPVTLFILLQFPLLVEIFMSTYGPSIFDRTMKPWYY